MVKKTTEAETVAELRAEIAALKAEREELAELHRMREAAICVATQCNTPESARQHRIEKGNHYWTLAYSDVCAAVDREMEIRAAAMPEDAGERVRRIIETTTRVEDCVRAILALRGSR